MPLEDRKVQLSDGKVLTFRKVDDEPPSVYVNNAVFEMTRWDVQMELSELRRTVPGETPDTAVALINQRVRLVMTVAYAKVFANTLLRHLGQYDEIEQKAAEAEIIASSKKPE